MSNWIPITIDTLYEAKVAALIDAASTLAKEDGQADRVPGLIQGVVDKIRRKIGSCKRNRVDADLTTIPKGLRDLAVDLIIARLKVAIEQELSEDERRNIARHEADLNRIADGVDVVEMPDNPITAPIEGSPGVSVVRPGLPPYRLNFDDRRSGPFSDV